MPLVTVVVSQATAKGAVVTSAPNGAPSIRNRTLATPTLSEASALMVVVPAMRPPSAGAVRAMAGEVLSTTTPTALLVTVLPAASRATAGRGWDPSEAGAPFHDIW